VKLPAIVSGEADNGSYLVVKIGRRRLPKIRLYTNQKRFFDGMREDLVKFTPVVEYPDSQLAVIDRQKIGRRYIASSNEAIESFSSGSEVAG